jgi:hypothetical protein
MKEFSIKKWLIYLNKYIIGIWYFDILWYFKISFLKTLSWVCCLLLLWFFVLRRIIPRLITKTKTATLLLVWEIYGVISFFILKILLFQQKVF